MDLDYYIGLEYPIQLEKDSDTSEYMASIPMLKGCMTCGKDKESALRNLVDAKREWVRTAMEREIKIPEPDVNAALSVDNTELDRAELWKNLLGSIPGGEEVDVKEAREERLGL